MVNKGTDVSNIYRVQHTMPYMVNKGTDISNIYPVQHTMPCIL